MAWIQAIWKISFKNQILDVRNNQNNLIVPQQNYYEFGTKTLASLGPKI